jgi:hypothetical protein
MDPHLEHIREVTQVEGEHALFILSPEDGRPQLLRATSASAAAHMARWSVAHTPLTFITDDAGTSLVGPGARVPDLRLVDPGGFRAPETRVADGRPVLDCDGRLHLGSRWIQLPSLVRRFAHGLLTHFGEPVSTNDLLVRCFTDEDTLGDRMDWLSTCVNPLGLEVVAVADDGFVMQLCRSPE